MKTQPREGQAFRLPLSANSDERTTHVAVNIKHGQKYFCRFDTETIHPQEGIPDDEVKGTYWITPCHLYGQCYNGSSLWQGGFKFYPLDTWSD